MAFLTFFLCGCSIAETVTYAVRDYVRSVLCFRRQRAARKHTVIW